MIGKTLGHYEITAQLGKGGMGEVYQAKDQKLGRDVAIKVLPEEFAKDADRVARFQREAKVLASLNHPNIGAISMEGDRAKKPLLHEKYAEVDPQISPDGRWMAYTSNESGKHEVYVSPYPEVKGGKWQVSTSGGDWPLWSRNGRELFYRSGDAFLAVSVRTEPTFSRETPEILFRGTYAQLPSVPFVGNWDISPDGKRFLMIKGAEILASAGGAPPKINIILNWFEELKQRVPAK